MGLINHKTGVYYDVSVLINKVFEMGLLEGYDRGYDDGYDDGYNKRRNEDKPAISDGLRKGSSQCGEAMQKMKYRG